MTSRLTSFVEFGRDLRDKRRGQQLETLIYTNFVRQGIDLLDTLSLPQVCVKESQDQSQRSGIGCSTGKIAKSAGRRSRAYSSLSYQLASAHISSPRY